MDQVLGALVIFTLVPALGALPLTRYIVRIATGKNLSKLGTGNNSVSAAFYHAGTPVGIVAVLAEAFKGIAAILIARYFFGADPIWPMMSLIFLVMGRYWGSQGAGTTNIAWGFFAYDPIVAGLTFLISFVGFTIFRKKQEGKYFVLVLMPVLTALRYPTDGARVLAVACLSGLMVWIYKKIPDDLELSTRDGESQQMFRFFKGDRALPSLDQPLDPKKVGAKAATLSQLRRWNYPVLPGYVISAGDDPAALVETIFPGIATFANEKSHDQKVVARSSAVGEDGLTSSAAGQYVSITNITSPAALASAVTACLDAYNAPSALRYRQSRNIPDGSMNVLVQPHISGQYSGVAFSRDPLAHCGDAVVVEALPGEASNVVSGKRTPERYSVTVTDALTENWPEDWHLPNDSTLPVEGEGKAPADLIQQIAYLARHIEDRFHGVPQDIEWTFDGEQIWILQSRPITTLLPIWTRKIAAEVIPGVIRPLTWSINRPLTCGVWGDLFTTVLGDRAADLDFEQTATLHNSYAYFNATLLGEIFTRMGLPAESLEFLTRGAKFSKPPLSVTLRNAPGLLRLLRQEMRLPKQFNKQKKKDFLPVMARWDARPITELSEKAVGDRIQEILTLLEHVTYYNILAPLSLAIRQAIFKVDLAALDNRKNAEVMAVEDLKAIARTLQREPADRESLNPFLDKYGHLSEVATDIAVPIWRESPEPLYELLAQYAEHPDLAAPKSTPAKATHWKQKNVQTRLDLKGEVADIYNRLLASLRGCFVEIEKRWLEKGVLPTQGDIFFLTDDEVYTQLASESVEAGDAIALHINTRKTLWQDAHERKAPPLVYGTPLANSPNLRLSTDSTALTKTSGTLQGIGASIGEIEGTVLVMTKLSNKADISADTVLVVPYTDAGWSPVLSRIGGLIAEVGGQLSHGAIVAREYGIPAVMDVTNATERLTNGQRVRINGQRGIIEIL